MNGNRPNLSAPGLFLGSADKGYNGSYKDRACHGQSEMNHPGPVNIYTVAEKKVNLGLCFRVGNAKKALIAVKRICEKGIKLIWSKRRRQLHSES